MSVRDAERRVGRFDAVQRAAYRAGVQHIIARHERVGSFTIAQVVDQQRARDVARAEAAQRERDRTANAARERQLAQERVREQAAAAVQQEQDRQRAAEGAHLQHGDPDCLVVDDRTLRSESGEYSGYIVGKLQNRCDRSMRYVSVHFTFLNGAGEVENSGIANVTDLGAGQTWAFRKPVYEVHGDYRWRLEKIVGYYDR